MRAARQVKDGLPVPAGRRDALFLDCSRRTATGSP